MMEQIEKILDWLSYYATESWYFFTLIVLIIITLIVKDPLLITVTNAIFKISILLQIFRLLFYEDEFEE